MDTLIISATDDSPGVNFDKEIGKFLLFGKSYPEDVRKFYDPVIYWLEEYIDQANEETNFEVRLDYYNSATSTILLEVFSVLEKLSQNGKRVKVVWHHLEIDEDMLDAGKEFEDILKIPFEYRIIEDTE